ncbi:Protein DedA [bioreactor metagenome]|uniref:Protein DedA n=1 Tax=bioreactor metagenome TaxID=1076179 RepID=A0A645H3Y9_9ZZZZ
MSYHRFSTFNVVCGIAWVCIFSYAGYLFGNLEFVQQNLKIIIVAIIIISIMPAVFEIVRNKMKSKQLNEDSKS